MRESRKFHFDCVFGNSEFSRARCGRCFENSEFSMILRDRMFENSEFSVILCDRIFGNSEFSDVLSVSSVLVVHDQLGKGHG
jgi:hypothetical protein